jgi:hypothetical protein
MVDFLLEVFVFKPLEISLKSIADAN